MSSNAANNLPQESLPLIKLPFWETCRRSFLYVILNLPALFKISAIWFSLLIYDIITGYPNICTINTDVCVSGWEQNVSSLLVAFAAVSIIVSFSRFIILKEPADKLRMISFGRREVIYILYVMLLIAALMIPMLIVSLTMTFSTLTYYLFMLTPLVLAILYARFYLIFPAVTVDNKEITLKKSFELTCGNANRIFWGQALMTVPVFAALILISVLYNIINVDNDIVKFIFVTLILSVSFIDAALKASFFAHAYQYFLYFDKKEKSKVSED